LQKILQLSTPLPLEMTSGLPQSKVPGAVFLGSLQTTTVAVKGSNIISIIIGTMQLQAAESDVTGIFRANIIAIRSAMHCCWN